jgi:hypothetical protein
VSLLRQEKERNNRLENRLNQFFATVSQQPTQQQQQPPPPPPPQQQQQQQQDNDNNETIRDDDNGYDREELDNNINIQLQNAEKVQPINAGMPLSFRDVIYEWTRERLGSYRNCKRKSRVWGSSGKSGSIL